jgi:copper chaperone CopZ
MIEKIININGMTCGHCESRVITELFKINGVKSVQASAPEKNATIISEIEISHDEILKAIVESGYTLVMEKND